METFAGGKKILVVTSTLPWPPLGAGQQDRLEGILQLRRLGYEVEVFVKVYKREYSALEEVQKATGIRFVAAAFRSEQEGMRTRNLWRRLSRPRFWDGSCAEFGDRQTTRLFDAELESFKPCAVLADFTYTWPLVERARRRSIPSYLRSHNYEPRHFLEENPKKLFRLPLYLLKELNERLAVRLAKHVFAINPQEARDYLRWRANVSVLPLRKLPTYVEREIHRVQDGSVLNVFFLGSTYNVRHNAEALRFILTQIIPRVRSRWPGKFVFHFLGKKFPDDMRLYLGKDAAYEGYVDDIEVFLEGMDIALAPSLLGAGMQQKIFEPLARGIPVISNGKGISEYPFEHGLEVFLADSVEEYLEAFEALIEMEVRKRLSSRARKKAVEIFSSDRLDSVILEVLP